MAQFRDAIIDVSNSDRNPLFAAIYNGHYDIVQFLVGNGIDITIQYSIGQLDYVDAHEYAKQYGHTEIAYYLKSKLESYPANFHLPERTCKGNRKEYR